MFKLDIQTPLQTLFSADVDYLQATCTDGLFGVLSNHAPMVSTLAFGKLLVRETGGKERRFCVGNGLFEVHANQAVILVNTAEEADGIDVARAQESKTRAEERLAEKKEALDFERARAALFRAITRIKISGQK